MKFNSLAVILMVFFGAVSLSAQSVDDLASISVSEIGEIKAVPDEAVFYLSVLKLNKDLSIAQRDNDAAISQIIKLSKDFGVDSKDIKTNLFQFEEKFTWAGKDEDKRVFLGFEVSKDAVVRLRDISKFEGFFRALIKTGLSKVTNITFETSRFKEFRAQAFLIALKAAKEKAGLMAAELGQSIGKAVRIRESGNSNYSSIPSSVVGLTTGIFGTVNLDALKDKMGRPGYSIGDDSTFSLGTITIAAEVSVTFLLN